MNFILIDLDLIQQINLMNIFKVEECSISTGLRMESFTANVYIFTNEQKALKFAFELAVKHMCGNNLVLPVEQEDNEELVQDYEYTWPSNDYGLTYPEYSVCITQDILDLNRDIICETTIGI